LTGKGTGFSVNLKSQAEKEPVHMIRTAAIALAAAALLLGAAPALAETCAVTVPMLQATPCDEYPSSLKGFCSTYKPFLMNMGECHKAEAWAATQISGGNTARCMEQTTKDGTTSQSYVWGCSQLPPEAPEGQ
jgi:hypothetical protein